MRKILLISLTISLLAVISSKAGFFTYLAASEAEDKAGQANDAAQKTLQITQQAAEEDKLAAVQLNARLEHDEARIASLELQVSNLISTRK